MSKLMQLSNLYIRGAIATQTMAGLTESEVDRINLIVTDVENDQEIAADRYQFIKQLGATIKGDYKSDPNTALQEFRIAIWRATVHLLHHRDYSYICSLCGSVDYNTSAGTIKAFDRQYKTCPKCEMSIIDTMTGSVVESIKVYILKQDNGHAIVNDNDNIIMFRNLTKDELEGKVRSPINTVYGPRKVEDPEQILNDRTQRSKWYVTWIWNYFRQILKENIIRTHNKHQIEICGAADRIAFQILVNELKRIHHKFSYDEGIPLGLTDDMTIMSELRHTPIAFSNMLFGLVNEFKGHNVDICVSKNSITVKKTGPIASISTIIESEDPVIMLSFEGPTNNDNGGDDSNWGDAVEFRSTGHIYDGKIDDLISDEAMNKVRLDLQDRNAQMTFDILSQTGDTWQQFSNRWGAQPARKAHIAEFLAVSPKQIDAYKAQIAAQCLSHGLR